MSLTDTRPHPATAPVTSIAPDLAARPAGPSPRPRPARFLAGPLRHPGWSAAICLSAALIPLLTAWPTATPQPGAATAAATLTTPAAALGH
jgi:hypothetical protein